MKTAQNNPKKELEALTNEAWFILTESIDCFAYYKTIKQDLHNIKYQKDFRFIMLLCLKTTVVELNKLFVRSDNHHFNLRIILRKVKNIDAYSKDTQFADQVEQWGKYLRNREPQIDMIKTLRDKFYAHTDRNRSFKDDLQDDDINVLIRLAGKIIFGIQGSVFDAHAEVTPSLFDERRVNMMLERLSR